MARNESLVYLLGLLGLLVATTIQTADGQTYPEKLTVSSTGGAAKDHTQSMGVYTKTSLTNSGRPVWQSSDRYLFYNGDWSNWVIYKKVSNDLAYIISQEKDLVQVPEKGWLFWNGNDWQDDQTLTATVFYPTKLTVSSTGGAAKDHTQSMGVYTKTSLTNSGRPVWQSNDRYLFYNGDWSKWVIYEKVSNDLAYIISQKRDLVQVPEKGWLFWNGNDWQGDQTLTATGGATGNEDNVDNANNVVNVEKEDQENQKVYKNSAYCRQNRQHTMCRYSAASRSCSSKTISRTLSGEAKQAVLDKHNQLRRRVAKGQERGQPAASNMKKLVWNAELASIAQRWADQCFGISHDASNARVKIDGTKVGQNAAYESNTKKLSKSALTAAMVSMTQKWYDEVKNPGFYSSVSSYRFNSGTAHYTQLVWADTDQVGCGMVYLDKGYFKDATIICNYAVAGNFRGSEMYKAGRACSRCPPGYRCDDGLCAK